MKTHIERLPECYSSIDEGLVLLPQDWGQKGWQEMTAKRMLVIDDEIRIREMYEYIFDSIGYEVLTAGNAMDAHEILVRNKFDIVLLDINMAEVDGATLFEVIRAFHKNIKVVVSSVYSINEQKGRIKDADGYFDKSDDTDVLTSLISSLLNKF